MSNSKEQVTGIRWDLIFERRPDLAPPGYHETVNAIYKDTADEKPQD